MAIAKQAWELFLAVEEDGGFYASVKSGKIQAAVNESNTARHAAVAKRKEVLLGTCLLYTSLGDALKLFQSKMDKSLKGKYVAGDKFIKGKHELFPIPLGELQANPALKNQNNPGYE